MCKLFQSRLFLNTCNVAGKGILVVMIMMQLSLVFFHQLPVITNGDGIFSYMLANNPYAYNFIDATYDLFPMQNGWLDAHILKESYTVEEYDRFNYASVYYHQRMDVHPPLYYYMVHTISSFFPGIYSNLYTLAINLIALFLIDVIMLKLFYLFYGKMEYAAVPLVILMLMNIMQFLYIWQRMYMLLFFFCLWYTYIHGKLFLQQYWKKNMLIQMIICIFLGSLTHYYFYIYACFLSILWIGYLVCRKQRYRLFNYLYAGIMGLGLSWTFYPFVMWHVLGNPQGKHTNIAPWTFEKVRAYLDFLNDKLFNGRVLVAGIVLMVLGLGSVFARRAFELFKHFERQIENGSSAVVMEDLGNKISTIDKERKIFRRFLLIAGMLYSILIYTLDRGSSVSFYFTAVYMCFVIWFSMLLIDLVRKYTEALSIRKLGGVIIGLSVICALVIFSVSAMESYFGSAQSAIYKIKNRESFREGIYKISEDYSDCDCIYIEKGKDNCFHNLLFEFGEYDEFKKISWEEFEQNGIEEKVLAGRNSAGNVVIYAPEEYALETINGCELIAGGSDYKVYYLSGRKNE